MAVAVSALSGADAQVISGATSCSLATSVPVTANSSTNGCQFTQTLTPTSAAANVVGIGLRNGLTISGNLSQVTGSTDILSGNFTTTFSGITGPISVPIGGFQAGLYVDGTNAGATFSGLRAYVAHMENNSADVITLLKAIEPILTYNAGTIANLRIYDCPIVSSGVLGGGSVTQAWCLYNPDPNVKVETAGIVRAANFDITGTSINGTSNGFFLNGPNTPTFRANSTNVMSSQGTSVTFLVPWISSPKTVATLPSCTSGMDGAQSFVTDATTTTFASTVVGSGTNHVPVYCDGANLAWRIG